MNVHLISDRFFGPELRELTLASASELGLKVTTSAWIHETLAQYRSDVLASEIGGPASVKYPLEYSQLDGLAQAEFLIVQFCPVAAELFAHAPKLKAIGVVRVGVENVDLAAAANAGVQVFNTPGRNTQSAAEYSVAMLQVELRDIARSHIQMIQNNWQVDYPSASERRELLGKTIGVVGAGAVGRICAKILVGGYDCKVLMHDPYASEFPEQVESVSLERLLVESDHVILHARLDSNSHHMIGKEQLAMMRNSAVIVNTARAGLVDTAALIEALTSGKIAGAALDVFDSEPLPQEHPLTKLPNVVLTPHIAGVTIEAWSNGPKMMSEIVRSFMQGNHEELPLV